MPAVAHHVRKSVTGFGSDQDPGIRRQGTKRFTYVNERTGRRVTMASSNSSGSAPPYRFAWTNVWIAADPSQPSLPEPPVATHGVVKQYRYHAVAFIDDRAKSHKLADRCVRRIAGQLRRRVDRDLRGGRVDTMTGWWAFRCAPARCHQPADRQHRVRPQQQFIRAHHHCATDTQLFAVAPSIFEFRGKSARTIDVITTDNQRSG